MNPRAELLHTLWTKAVGTPDYDKSQWRALEKALLVDVDRCQACGLFKREHKLINEIYRCFPFVWEGGGSWRMFQ